MKAFWALCWALHVASVGWAAELVAPTTSQSGLVNLVPLINETLAIQTPLRPTGHDNSSTRSSEPEWTFDMVEYDLMDFLQDLKSRYSARNLTEPPTEPPQEPTKAALPVTSLADQEPAESSWQYGIFDRFTRPRTSSTGAPSSTREPHYDPIGEAADALNRNYNHDECGLRTYRDPTEAAGSSWPHQYPQVEASEPQQVEAGHEKSLRRPAQRPKSPSGAELGWDREDEAPTGSELAAEFDLASRRHWLQQQLGQSLQLLGLNASGPMSEAQLAALELANQTGGAEPLEVRRASGGQVRENMMKMSGRESGRARRLNASSPAADEAGLIGRQDELKLEARVIGGQDARLGDSPWSVSLQALVSRPGTGAVEYRHYCGGTIISDYYVLTAAHCLDFMVGRESRLFVVVGDLNWRMSSASLHGRRFGIEKLIIHSGYKSTAFGHDIGLIRTKESMRRLKVNGRYIINSVCLPDRNQEHTGEAELVGWGLFSNRNEMADTLQIADVPILPRPLCVDLYRRRTGLIQWLIGIELITNKQVCAGTFGRGICQGDSGSALVVNERLANRKSPADLRVSQKQTRAAQVSARDQQQSRATQIGIVAFGGIRRCSYQSLPGVYMQTSKYMDWIVPRIQD